MAQAYAVHVICSCGYKDIAVFNGDYAAYKHKFDNENRHHRKFWDHIGDDDISWHQTEFRTINEYNYTIGHTGNERIRLVKLESKKDEDNEPPPITSEYISYIAVMVTCECGARFIVMSKRTLKDVQNLIDNTEKESSYFVKPREHKRNTGHKYEYEIIKHYTEDMRKYQVEMAIKELTQKYCAEPASKKTENIYIPLDQLESLLF